MNADELDTVSLSNGLRLFRAPYGSSFEVDGVIYHRDFASNTVRWLFELKPVPCDCGATASGSCGWDDSVRTATTDRFREMCNEGGSLPDYFLPYRWTPGDAFYRSGDFAG